MTQSDLRAAAERVVRSCEGESLFSIYCTTLATDALRKHAADCGALAEHILASHPPDGETEIDEAWLRTVMRECDPGVFEATENGGDVTNPLVVTVMASTGTVQIRRSLQGDLGGFCVTVKTRSDLRGLCAALGISLKEEKEA